MVALLSNRRLLGATLGHFLQDIWLVIVPIMMATASYEMGLTNAQVGLGYTLYESISGLTQPFFGHLTERYGSRWFGVGGVLWTSLMVGMAGFAPNYLFLVTATGLAGLGSGAFHPQGTGNAAAAGGQDRRATSAAVFFLGGTLGQALVGAALGGLIMTYLGMRGIALLSALVWVVALTVLRPALPSDAPRISARSSHAESRVSRMTVSWLGVMLLLGAMATRSMSRASFTGYMPKLWQDAGHSAAEYGFLLSLYLAGSALGGVTGSYVADKLGRKRVLLLTLGLAIPAGLWLLYAEGFWAYVAAVVAGAVGGPAHTLLVVTAQEMIPGRVALASGLAMGFTFVAGSAGLWLAGVVADQWGLLNTLTGTTLVLLVSIACIFVALPSDKRRQTEAGGSL